MSGLVRYSSIDTGFRREFLLLQGTGCRWHGCTFCDYHLDRSSDPFEVNKEVLAMVSGRYGVLDIIDSGSAMELDERTLSLIADMVRQKNIHDLWFEAHWMYRHQLEAFSSRFDCRVHYRTGIESFNPELRVKWNKGVGRDVTPEDVARYFDGVCLLAGMEGQSADDVMRSVEIAESLFSYYSVNLFCPNTSSEKRNDELARIFIDTLAPQIRRSTKAEVLIDNRDLGVG